MPPDAGHELRDGRYVVTGVLGQGAQGATLDGVDKRDGRAVAIKHFQIRGAKSWKDVELAEREARVLAQVAHPTLPAYVDHFEEDGALFLVMEKIEGESVASLRARKVVLAEADVVRFLGDAAWALEYLHTRSPPLIHRDLKPGNIIRRPDGTFAFVDFGSVRDTLKPEGGSTVVGTFGYMAPEQFQGRALPATDVYGVGTTALVMLTGQEPENLPHQGLAIDVDRALAGSASPALIHALRRMLEPDPDKRAQSIGPLMSALIDGPPRADRPREKKTKKTKRRSRRERQRRPRMPPLIRTGLVILLLMAQVAVFVGLKVLLPLALSLLSLVLGRSVSRLAARVSRAGERAGTALGDGRRFLSSGPVVEPEVEPAWPRQRWRVRPDRSRVRFDEDAFEDDLETEAGIDEEERVAAER